MENLRLKFSGLVQSEGSSIELCESFSSFRLSSLLEECDILNLTHNHCLAGKALVQLGPRLLPRISGSCCTGMEIVSIDNDNNKEEL